MFYYSPHIFKPGSAWSEWYHAGIDWLMDGNVIDDVEEAAIEYANDKGYLSGNPRHVSTKAFKAGATHFHKTEINKIGAAKKFPARYIVFTASGEIAY